MSDNASTVARTTDQRRVRILITKNSKGYSHETTVEYCWNGDPGERFNDDQIGILKTLLTDADELARTEIADRERADARAQAEE
ncbi:MAG: hypothetical protein IT477_10700 [Rhodanobacteraceae bacterium]|nr:hypothetical protein [Rhodanobacteraceae bacterium]